MNEQKPIKENKVWGWPWFPCVGFNGDIDPTADFAEAVGELRETASTLTD